MKKHDLYIYVLLLFVFFASCHKIETYPITPQIEFKSFEKHDSSIIFTFIDGDGDIGFNEGDTLFDESGDTIVENLFVTLYEKVDSVFEEVILLIPLYYRIPNVVPQGQNKTLKGDIIFEFSSIKPFDHDTFQFEFYIIDNSLHKSNTELTPALTFNELK